MGILFSGEEWVDTDGDGLYDSNEEYTDSNGSGSWDPGDSPVSYTHLTLPTTEAV